MGLWKQVGAYRHMEDAQAKLVEQSYVCVFARKAELATKFYDHLFQQNPDLRALFQEDMYVQREMFVSILAMILKFASRPQTFHELASRLARQHENLGVTHAQYAMAVDALMAALQDVLQNEMAPETAQAWKKAIQELVSHMAPQNA